MKYLLLLAVTFTVSFSLVKKQKEVTVKNSLAFDRHEIVTIPKSKLKGLWNENSEKKLTVKEKESGKTVLSQVVDNNSDGIADELLFEVVLTAKEEKTFIIETSEGNTTTTDQRRTYSRLAPERIDDYAWENDLVAFRTYGPEAQRLVDAKEKGGTLSSGMDCWLKRVNYSVIDKWYKKYVDGGSYHKDDGEGYDPYHVGASRGSGGIGVWKNDSLYVSKNFISYKKIAEGPVRNIFELTYAPWLADGISINETKRITIDLGSQMYQVEDILTTSAALPNCTIGITLHDKKGVTKANAEKGWFSYWEPVDDSEIGTGVVIEKKYLIDYKDFRTEKKDLSQLYVIAKPLQSKLIYHTGFGWKKAGVITTHESWNAYLDRFSQCLISPLQVSFK